jgi:predicted nucleotidyltransferase
MAEATAAQVLKREDAARVLRAHAAELRARGIIHVALFGSAARGEAGPESDIDVVIDLEPGRKFSLIDLASVRVRLCDLFGRESDVLIREDLRPEFRRAIARETFPVF